MSDIPDLYATLHLPRDATQQQISRAYRALMRSHHPDMEGGRSYAAKSGAGLAEAAGPSPLPEGELLRIMQAFAVLRDPARRAAYDRDVKAQQAGPEAWREPASGAGARGQQAAGGPRDIPVRKVKTRSGTSGSTIRVTPVRWESGPWA